MRLDKYLKVSRLIKRRTIAKEACDAGKIMINDKIAKAGTEVNVGDRLTIQFGNQKICVKIDDIKETVRAHEAESLYTMLSKTQS